MAVRHGYGKVAGADALVFAYDTGDTSNSYRGEPTTNLNPYTLSDSGTDGSGQGSVGTRTILSSNHVRIVDVNSNTRQQHLITGLTGGTVYTISIEFKKLSGTPTFRFQIQDHSGGTYLRTIKFTNTAETGLVDKEGWQTASWTFTLGADANAVRIWYQDGADYTTYTHSFELRNPQLEAKSHPTPYTAPGTTRSATQGLLDLTGKNSISLSNLNGYDSNAQIVFDGTDDYISVPHSTELNITGPMTSEVVFLIDSNPGDWVRILGKGNGENRTYGLWYNYDSDRFLYQRYGSGTTANAQLTSAGIQLNTYYHMVGVSTATTHTLYINGVEVANVSNSNTFLSTSDTLNIGFSNAHTYHHGEAPVAKVYNRALTAAEVKNNYNNYKGRFNI